MTGELISGHSIGHVLHLEALHGWRPGNSCNVIVRVTRIRRSLKFLGHQKPINSRCQSASYNCCEVWIIDRWHLVIRWKHGRIGWCMYVTTKGMRAVFSRFGFDCNMASLVISNALLNSFSKCSLLQPRERKYCLNSRVLFRYSVSAIIWTGSLESQRLTKWNRSLAV